MAEHQINRRRFIQILGAFGACTALPISVLANERAIIEWDGISLGADSNIKLFHPDKDKAKKILSASLKEITRLEKIFSLYRDDSLIVELNKNGILKNPPKEFRELIEKSKYFGDITNGQFDITVQSLWNKSGGTDLVDYKKIRIEEDIFFEKQGMQITLNGIAQGYITDKVTELLRNEGIDNALVSLGEKYALGSHPQGGNWRIGVANSDKVIELNNQAIATSNNDIDHIYDPRSGKLAKKKQITVIADNATKADALSTALCLGDVDGAEEREAIKVI